MANDEEYEAVDGTTWSYRVKDGEATIIKCLRCLLMLLFGKI